MMYDLASEPPEPGSLLESVFMLITVRRREAELFKTEALVAAIVGSATDQMNLIEDTLTAYKNSMFPFLENEKVRRADLAKKALEQWTSHKALKVRPLWMMGDHRNRRLSSQLKRSEKRTQEAEDTRRKKRHKRL